MAVTNRQIPNLVERTAEFRANSVRGEIVTSAPDTGRLPSEWADEFRTSSPVYVVFSYDTPIAWVTFSGERVMPDEKYSVTTSKHQNLVRQGWHGEEIREEVRP